MNSDQKINSTSGSVVWGASNTLGKGNWVSAGVDQYWQDGYIQEILFFSRKLDSEERILVNLYLSKKWLLTDRVDSDGDGIVDGSDLDANGDGVDDKN